jgi:hypothetical protein
MSGDAAMWLLFGGILAAAALLIFLSEKFDLAGVGILFMLGCFAYAVISAFVRQFPDFQTVTTLIVGSAVGGAYIHKWLNRKD